MGELVLAAPGDLSAPTGGYSYDRRVLAELAARGHSATALPLPGGFPAPSDAAVAEAFRRLAFAPAGATLVIDGLAMGALPAEGLRALGRPLVALVHHPLALETGLSVAEAARLDLSERGALGCAAAMIVTSEATKRLLVGRYGVDEGAVSVARPGVDAAPRAARTGDPAVVLTVGAVTPRKNHLALCEALGRLRASAPELAWRWRIVGALDRDPAAAEALRAAIECEGIGDRTELLGAVDTASLAKAYETADLFALPSWLEGYGMAWAEALARGLPVIAGAGAAASELVPATAGALVPAWNVGAISEALDRLIRDPDRRRAASDAAWERAATLPTWADCAETFERVMAAVGRTSTSAARGRPPRPHSMRFDADWLALREPADHRALCPDVLAAVVPAHGGRDRVKIADLGSGSGSMLRALAPHLGPRQDWTLVDDDPHLLLHARALLADWAEGAEREGETLTLRRGGRTITVRTELCDLAENPAPAALLDADLVTGAALLDLVSEVWLETFAGALTEGGNDRSFYATLVHDGAVRFSPAHEADEAVLAAFARHQERDKGFGAALGRRAPEGVRRMADAMPGRALVEGSSPWRLTGRSAGLVRAYVEGVARAVSELSDRPVGLDDWLRFRLAEAETGAVEVGHRDFFLAP